MCSKCVRLMSREAIITATYTTSGSGVQLQIGTDGGGLGGEGTDGRMTEWPAGWMNGWMQRKDGKERRWRLSTHGRLGGVLYTVAIASRQAHLEGGREGSQFISTGYTGRGGTSVFRWLSEKA